MNFYPHHIGDFNNATRHLTRVERSVYRDLIELYYDTECPLNNDLEKLFRRALCVNDEEKKALIDVLAEFFIKDGNKYLHERCDIEIAKYRANASAKARAGIASAKARQQKLTDKQHNSTHVEQTLNFVQQTNNQEPLTINHKKPIKGSRLSNDWALPDEWIKSAQLINNKLSVNQVIYIAEGFKDYWISLSGARAVKSDWLATWRNWIRKQEMPKDIQILSKKDEYL